MPASARRERYAHRARWRPVPKAVKLPLPNSSRTALVPGRQVRRGAARSHTSVDRNSRVKGLELPHLFTPAEAAEILRCLGLTEITECVLRALAYRRQVPFHLNRRRVRFTASDLHEIFEGQTRRPNPIEATAPPQPARRKPDDHSQ
jgi:hypothetical protein